MQKSNFSVWEKYPIVAQFFRFVVIGVINTGIDFGIVNLLMFATNIYAGGYTILYKVISFIVANTNSFFWNRYWTFKVKNNQGTEFQYLQFFVVSGIGLGINTGIFYLVNTSIGPMFGITRALWANLSLVAATGFSLIWNFIGYKFIVFKKK